MTTPNDPSTEANAPTGGDKPVARWPWEEDPESSEHPRIPAGPPVRTDDLYRAHEASATDTAPIDVPRPIAPADAYDVEEESAVDTGSRQAGWRASWVFIFIAGVTVAVGLLDMNLNREFSYWTGIAFVIASIVGAVKVRPVDIWFAVINPPIAYLLALIIAGQLTTIAGAGNLLVREASLLATGLAFNAPYIYGGTLAAFIIVMVRRRKFARNN